MSDETARPADGVTARQALTDEVFRVMGVEHASGTTGSGKKLPRSRLVLQNARYADIQAVDWDSVLEFKQGDVVKITGSIKEFRGQPQITIRSAARLENFDVAKLLPVYQGDVAILEARLEAYIKAIPDERLQHLAAKLTDPSTEMGKKLRLAPASPATISHEPYIHGLVQHLTEVSEIAQVLASKAVELRPTEYGKLNISIVMFGALLHDLAKTTAYEYGAEGIKFSPAGRLNGHVLESYALVRNALYEAGTFSQGEIDNILHIVASHHGPESDQPPRTIEAWIVHTADLFCSKLGGTFGYPHNPVL